MAHISTPLFPTVSPPYDRVSPIHIFCGIGMATGISLEAIKTIIGTPRLCQPTFIELLKGVNKNYQHQFITFFVRRIALNQTHMISKTHVDAVQHLQLTLLRDFVAILDMPDILENRIQLTNLVVFCNRIRKDNHAVDFVRNLTSQNPLNLKEINELLVYSENHGLLGVDDRE